MDFHCRRGRSRSRNRRQTAAMKRKERPSAAAIKRAEKDDLVERLKLSHAMVQLVDNEGNTTGPVRPSYGSTFLARFLHPFRSVCFQNLGTSCSVTLHFG